MQKINFHRIFMVVGILSLFVSYLGIWIRLINDPIERTGSDFIHFFSAGRIAQTDGMAHVYDLGLQHDIQEEQVGFPLGQEQVLPYNHLPFLIPMLKIVITEDYVVSFIRWVLLLIVIHVFSIIIFTRTMNNFEIDRSSMWTAATGGLLFLPFFFSLMNGQDTSILLLGTAIWAYGILLNREWLAGLGLSLTTVRPHIALLFAIPMLFRHPRVFLAFVIGSGVLASISFAILGLQGTQEFLNIILISAGGDWYGVKQNVMFNLLGLLMRTFAWVEADKIRLLGWIIYGTTIIALAFVWRKSEGQKVPLIGLTGTLAVLVAPHLHFHDLTLILAPIFMMLIASPIGWIKTSHAASLPLVVSLLLLASNVTPFLQFTVPYVLILSLLVFFTSQLHKNTRTASHKKLT